MPTSADVALLREMQEDIRSLVVTDLAAFWASLALNRPEVARDALLEFVPPLVSQYGGQSAALAADWYDDVRSAERIPGRFRATMLASPYESAVEPTVRRAAGALFTDSPLGTLTILTAASPKYALAAGRETIASASVRDPQASGWHREVRSGGCEFCRLLAGRGGVYTEATAHFAAHDDCNCVAAPSWDASAPEVPADVYKASERTTGMTPARKARHNALIQRAINEYVR